MIELRSESDICVQSDAPFTCHVILVDGKRLFATEDGEYLRNSPRVFEEDEATLVLEWDRNSMELPELGPPLDEDWFPGPLFLQRKGDALCFQSGHPSDRVALFEVPLSEWLDAVRRMQVPPTGGA